MSKEYSLEELQQKIGYSFSNVELLKQAMTHSSYANERKINRLHDYERIEFLGDAVLEVVTSEFLFKENHLALEGELTKLRASIVCEPALAYCAREISLEKYIFLGKGEEATGGRKRDSIISDVMEAVIGAIYLDGGFANAKEYIDKYILLDIESKKLFNDSKTILQEIVQMQADGVVEYKMIKETGPDHNKEFLTQVLINGKKAGEGAGRNKKAAEQKAAYEALLILKKK